MKIEGISRYIPLLSMLFVSIPQLCSATLSSFSLESNCTSVLSREDDNSLIAEGSLPGNFHPVAGAGGSGALGWTLPLSNHQT